MADSVRQDFSFNTFSVTQKFRIAGLTRNLVLAPENPVQKSPTHRLQGYERPDRR